MHGAQRSAVQHSTAASACFTSLGGGGKRASPMRAPACSNREPAGPLRRTPLGHSALVSPHHRLPDNQPECRDACCENHGCVSGQPTPLRNGDIVARFQGKARWRSTGGVDCNGCPSPKNPHTRSRTSTRYPSRERQRVSQRHRQVDAVETWRPHFAGNADSPEHTNIDDLVPHLLLQVSHHLCAHGRRALATHRHRTYQRQHDRSTLVHQELTRQLRLAR